MSSIKRRDFIKITSSASLLGMLPWGSLMAKEGKKLRIAQIGLGGMGMSDLKSISSHADVEVIAICDVDSERIENASKIYTKAKKYVDYQKLLSEIGDQIDAVVVSTPDHAHAPISLKAMELNKHVYCQKPLTRYVSESRMMDSVAASKKLVTQMGIQVHSFYDYMLATKLIQGGIIGKVKKVIAWSPKVWGFDGAAPEGSDPVPENLDWNLWLGTAKFRPYKDGFYHPSNWRKCIDYGCATLGDMGVHVFDTPYNALKLTVPLTVKNNCRKPNGFGHPEKNEVTYTFPGTAYTTDKLEWVWNDGLGAPKPDQDLILPNNDKLTDTGAMFIGENGKRLLLPHFMKLPQLIVNGQYEAIDISAYDPTKSLGDPVRNYDGDSVRHYHEFVDVCLGKKAETSAPFSYSAKLTEVILLGVIAAQFPNKVLHWNNATARFKQRRANKFLSVRA